MEIMLPSIFLCDRLFSHVKSLKGKYQNNKDIGAKSLSLHVYKISAFMIIDK